MRQRELSYDINTLLKFNIIKNNNLVKEDPKNTHNYKVLKEYTSVNIFKKEPNPNFSQEHNINFKPPKYEFQKRLYISKDKHLKFHEKASIVKLEEVILILIKNLLIS